MTIDLTQLITAEDKQALAAADVTAAMLAVTTTFREDREGYLNRLSGIGFAAQNETRPDIVQHVLNVRQGLLDLTAQPSVLAATTVVGLQQAMLVQYATILSDVPLEIKAVFRGLDA